MIQCCSVQQCIAVRCSMLYDHRVTVFLHSCAVLQCCSAQQYVTVSCMLIESCRIEAHGAAPKRKEKKNHRSTRCCTKRSSSRVLTHTNTHTQTHTHAHTHTYANKHTLLRVQCPTEMLWCCVMLRLWGGYGQ